MIRPDTPHQLTIGSLCSGMGGLDLAVEQFFGARTAWFSEFEEAPSRILAHHWPDVPNLGDMTKIDWATVEPVDIIAGGTPCQDLSGAGKRKGMTEGTRSNLWVQMREAIATIKPRIVVWENVRGSYSAYAYSEMELEQGLLGESYGPARPALRALARVLGDLSDLGYSSRVVPVRASDAGAPHARFRVFVIAVASSVGHERTGTSWGRGDGPEDSGEHAPEAVALFPTPKASDGAWSTPRTSGRPIDKATHLGTITTLLPTPTASYGGGTAEAHAARKNKNGGNREAVTGLNFVVEESLPKLDAVTEYEMLWDSLDDQSPFWVTEKGIDYWPAISRWASVVGRKSPSPTIPDGKNGKHRLNPRFPEWLMGCDDGWLTDPAIWEGLGWSVSKIRNAALKAAGNGVVTRQALLAFAIGWPAFEDVAVYG